MIDDLIEQADIDKVIEKLDAQLKQYESYNDSLGHQMYMNTLCAKNTIIEEFLIKQQIDSKQYEFYFG